jgi:hypothetical protein
MVVTPCVEPRFDRKSNKGEPRFAFGWMAEKILAGHSGCKRVVGAEGLEPPTYAL